MDFHTPEWLVSQHCPEYVRYAQARLSPTSVGAGGLADARAALLATPFVRQILADQRVDGGWTAPPDEWYRSLPRTIELLLSYGFSLADDPLRRAMGHLLSLQRSDGGFAAEEPGAIPFDEAYNAGCVRALVAAGLREDHRTRAAAERLLAARRHDGGWSTLPAWWRTPGVVLDPEPSCPICTGLAAFALGAALDLPGDLRAWFLTTALTVDMDLPAPARAERLRTRLAFMANQGMRAGDAEVNESVVGLLACQDADGRFGDHLSLASYVPGALADTLASHLLWRLGWRAPAQPPTDLGVHGVD
jgi:hypothetical protein